LQVPGADFAGHAPEVNVTEYNAIKALLVRKRLVPWRQAELAIYEGCG
jgi:hypothetical protein